MLDGSTRASQLLLRHCGALSRHELLRRTGFSESTLLRRFKAPETLSLAELKALKRVVGLADEDILKLLKSL